MISNRMHSVCYSSSRIIIKSLNKLADREKKNYLMQKFFMKKAIYIYDVFQFYEHVCSGNSSKQSLNTQLLEYMYSFLFFSSFSPFFPLFLAASIIYAVFVKYHKQISIMDIKDRNDYHEGKDPAKFSHVQDCRTGPSCDLYKNIGNLANLLIPHT